ncbi:hypothetical protein DFR86_10925 [Acidianus sulfidivorans JP7]|uniref:Uncharacterized protein n=1 Tax=Acidianus sulfidivorans JP7 TaxID=619593 RepID=A0A2U9IPT4_9CREN|nr:hypothetical protein [Acidianus sulfidivorans]AWR97997.1 hypothetical protein DFR86_10925 [Acidianus sulfidivorans JP7]
MSSRDFSWNIAASIGFSFILTIVMSIMSLLIKAFYPPSFFTFAPIEGIIRTPVEGVIQLIILGLFIAFTYPVRTKVEEAQLLIIRKVGLFTVIGYIAFSLLPYAIVTSYLQTFIGLIIAYNVLNGVFGGVVTQILNK